MKNWKVALLQMTSGSDLDSNLAKIIHYAKKASEEGAKLLCLPENFSFFGSEKEKWENLKKISSTTRDVLKQASQENNIHILGGGYPFPTDDQKKYYNQASLFNDKGEEIFQYRKIHLFDTEPGDGVSYKESRYTEAGSDLPGVVDLNGLCKLTSFICYDLRFPEVFRYASRNGAEIICLPAAFTVPTGIAHWEILLRARAIENFCFILAPAQVGVNSPNRKTYGHTMVVDPWGKVVGELDSEKEGLLVVELDPGVLEESRKKIPALNHRRFL